MGRFSERIFVEPSAQARLAGVTALIVGLYTAIFTALGMADYGSVGDFVGPWQLADVAATFGLAIGILRFSRVCAVIMLVYWIANRVYFIVVWNTGLPTVSMIIAVIFLLGVHGTFAYHNDRRRAVARKDGSNDAPTAI